MDTIREKAINAIKGYLSTITIANGYSRDIGPKRVYGIKETPSEVIPPAIILMQGDEIVENNIGERFSCYLEVAIGFVDKDKTSNPDKDATTFMAEIQLAVPIEFDVICEIYPSGNAIPGKIVLMEKSNSINITAAVPGVIMGQITYEMQYRRNIYDPSRF